MPGHIIEARCECGYGAILSPGSPDFDQGSTRVMAYFDSGGDNEIGTFSIKQAIRNRLKTVKDPYIEAAPKIVKCPKCKTISLALTKIGYWD